MNLYLISQTDNQGYDTFSSAVVAAENEKDAVRISPNDLYTWSEEDECWLFGDSKERDYFSSWTEPKNIKCELIGSAEQGMKKGLIMSSFNAG